jgi:hypothetical protein
MGGITPERRGLRAPAPNWCLAGFFIVEGQRKGAGVVVGRWHGLCMSVCIVTNVLTAAWRGCKRRCPVGEVGERGEWKDSWEMEIVS